MQIEVYESDAEALEAAAALVEVTLTGMASARPVVGIAGGRGGRALMLALSGRGDLPWARTRFCVIDEACSDAAEEPSNRTLLHEHLLGPRGVSSVAAAGGSGAGVWEAEVQDAAGPDLAFDLLVLALGEGGEIGVLDAETASSTDPAVNIVRAAARIGLGPAVLRRAGRVIMVATGAPRSRALAAAMRPATGVTLPAHLVLPSERVTWFADRAAAAELLRDAEPAPA
jgi:6-phosphogluconolactonase/glucosamine-6-phosphate isomerase/deaminase